MMYKCDECSHIFEEGEQKTWREPHGEKMNGCPLCFSSYREISSCLFCGRFENMNADESCCPDCKKRIKDKFCEFVDNNFTLNERNILNEIYDGKRI